MEMELFLRIGDAGMQQMGFTPCTAACQHNFFPAENFLELLPWHKVISLLDLTVMLPV